jgi:hypothetical protein
MTNEDKQLLAKCYQNAWNAVKNRTVTVTVELNGWFYVKYHVGNDASIILHTSRVRASRLLFGLSELTEQLAQNEVTA